jgi:hypothetical protein
VNNQTATSNKLTVSVNTQLEGEKTYAWTGMAGTNPGNSNEYTMVEDDENQTVMCTVTIGAESKSASVTVQPVWANLNPLGAGSLPFENRSTSKTDAQMTNAGYYADSAQMTPQKIATGQWNASKTENEIKDKVATYPVKKIVVIESGSTSYANGIIYLPYHYLFDSDSAGTTMGDLNTQYKAAYASLVVLAKQQGIRLAAVYYSKTDIRG